MHHDLIVGGLVEGDDSCSELGVEPSSGLVVCLHDELWRPPCVILLLLRRVSEGCPCCDSGVEPYVKDVRHPVHGLPALGAGECDLVDPRPVDVHALGVTVGSLELLDLTDRLPLTAFALPDGDRDSPVPLPGDAPVPGALDPVLLSGGTCPIGDPLDPVDLGEHVALDLGDGDEPLPGVPVDDGGLAPPAVSVSVLDLLGVEEDSLLLQVLDDLVVGGLDLLSLHHGECLGVPSCLSDGTERLHAVPLSGIVIVGTESGCGVDETGVVVLDVIRIDDLVDVLGPLQVLGVDVERRDVCHSDHVLSFVSLDDLELLVATLLGDVLRLGLETDDDILAGFTGQPEFRIVELGVCGDGHVGREGPGGGGPNEEGGGGIVDEGHPDHDGWVGLVPVLDLRLCESGLTSGTPGDDPAAGIEESSVVSTLDGPPCGFDVLLVECLVGVFPIHPYSELLELLSHARTEGECVLPTSVDEIVDTDDLLDLLLGPDTDLVGLSVLVDPSGDLDHLLDLDLDGETVHVVTRLVTDVKTVHPPVSEEDVLDGLVECGTHVDMSSGVWGPIDEIELLSVFPEGLCLQICIFGFPGGLDLLFDCWCIIIRADLLYHR